jgi:hypothetical protein
MLVLCATVCGQIPRHMEAFKLVYSNDVTKQVEVYCDGIALTAT